ncbi:MAG: hypothetical protein IJ242_16480 [Clostridia bacterium]|nr:hypothetical protein [Clostridia bacterium]
MSFKEYRMKIDGKWVAGIVLPVVAALISIVVLGGFFDSDSYKSGYMDALSRKQKMAGDLTIAAAGASVVIAAVPDDSTTPIAQEIANIASKLVLVTVVIMFEKLLVSIAGFTVFRVLVPIVCALFLLGHLFRKRTFAQIAFRLLIFALCLVFVVPLSLFIDEVMDKRLGTTQMITQAMEAGEEVETEEATECENKSLLSQASSFLGGIGDSIRMIPEQAQHMLTSFMNGVAVMILTVCVTPVVSVLLLYLTAKMLFNLTVIPSYLPVLYERKGFPDDEPKQKSGIRK